MSEEPRELAWPRPEPSHRRRGTDYYDEGDLIWLEVATIIRRETGGKKSIDDFTQAFHGGPNNGPEVKTYTFDQLMSASKCDGAL